MHFFLIGPFIPNSNYSYFSKPCGAVDIVVSEQLINLMVGKISAPETSLVCNYQPNGQRPTNNPTKDPPLSQKLVSSNIFMNK